MILMIVTPGPFKFVDGPRAGEVYDHDLAATAVEFRCMFWTEKEGTRTHGIEIRYKIDHENKTLHYYPYMEN